MPNPLSPKQARLAATLLYRYAQTHSADMNEDTEDALALAGKLLGIDSTEVQNVILGGIPIPQESERGCHGNASE